MLAKSNGQLASEQRDGTMKSRQSATHRHRVAGGCLARRWQYARAAEGRFAVALYCDVELATNAGYPRALDEVTR